MSCVRLGAFTASRTTCEYLIVYGTARVTEGGAAEVLQRLAYTYIGPDVVFPNMPDPPPGFVTRITPKRIGGVGP